MKNHSLAQAGVIRLIPSRYVWKCHCEADLSARASIEMEVYPVIGTVPEKYRLSVRKTIHMISHLELDAPVICPDKLHLWREVVWYLELITHPDDFLANRVRDAIYGSGSRCDGCQGGFRSDSANRRLRPLHWCLDSTSAKSESCRKQSRAYKSSPSLPGMIRIPPAKSPSHDL